jgi:hypothetical protein
MVNFNASRVSLGPSGRGLRLVLLAGVRAETLIDLHYTTGRNRTLLQLLTAFE